MKSLKIIKAIVFVLTVAIFFTFGLVVYKLSTSSSKDISKEIKKLELNQPAGSEIENIKIEDNILFIHVKNGGLKERVIVIDSKENKIKSEIIL